MAELPENARKKFDRAWDNVSPAPGPSNQQTSAEAMNKLSAALVPMTEGLALSALEAQVQLSSSIGALTAEVRAAADSADKTANALARYTKWLAVFTFLLVVATAALVYLQARQPPVPAQNQGGPASVASPAPAVPPTR